MKRPRLTYESTLRVRDDCLCLQVQRAARALARRFDDVLRIVELTNGQFSLMMSLNRRQPPSMRSVADLLAMDRTTLTAALKALEPRGLITVRRDPTDGRRRLLRLTNDGLDLLGKAFPIWEREHRSLEAFLGANRPNLLRRDLRSLT